MAHTNAELPVVAGRYETDPAELVHSGIADAETREYWAVDIPGLGELWSYDRRELTDWFKAVADALRFAAQPEYGVWSTGESRYLVLGLRTPKDAADWIEQYATSSDVGRVPTGSLEIRPVVCTRCGRSVVHGSLFCLDHL